MPGDLKEKADDIRNLLADTDFDSQLYGYNADFIEAFAKVGANFDLSGFQIMAPDKPKHAVFNGTVVRFAPSLLAYRKTKANTQKIGGIMYRYAKGAPVPQEVAEFQAAFMFGVFSTDPFVEGAKPEDKLCMVLDAVSGATFTSPAKAIYKFNEMCRFRRDRPGNPIINRPLFRELTGRDSENYPARAGVGSGSCFWMS